MTASVLQERQTSNGGATVPSVSLAFSSNLTAGSTLHVVGSQGQASTVTYTFSDTVNAYTSQEKSYDTGNNQGIGHGTAVNVAAGATTVKVTFSVSSAFTALWIREIGGVGTASLDGHNSADNTGGTGSVTATNANQPALISAVAVASSTPAATSGTQDSSGWLFGTVTNFGTSSHQRITTTGSQSASFSSTSGLCSVIAIFDESTGATVQGMLPQSFNRLLYV